MINTLKNKINKIWDLKKLENDFEEVKDGAKKEFFDYVEKYNTTLRKIEYLNTYNIDPFDDEMNILEDEAKVLKMRIGKLKNEINDKYTEMRDRISKMETCEKVGVKYL